MVCVHRAFVANRPLGNLQFGAMAKSPNTAPKVVEDAFLSPPWIIRATPLWCSGRDSQVFQEDTQAVLGVLRLFMVVRQRATCCALLLHGRKARVRSGG